MLSYASYSGARPQASTKSSETNKQNDQNRVAIDELFSDDTLLLKQSLDQIEKHRNCASTNEEDVNQMKTSVAKIVKNIKDKINASKEKERKASEQAVALDGKNFPIVDICNARLCSWHCSSSSLTRACRLHTTP
jgi:hypothetical protein